MVTLVNKYKAISFLGERIDMKMKKGIVTLTAGVFYICGLLFAAFIASIVLRGNTYFDLSSLIICALGVAVPVAIGSTLLVTSTQDKKHKKLVMKVLLTILLAFYSILITSLLFIGNHRLIWAISAFNDGVNIMPRANLVPFKTIVSYYNAFLHETINSKSIYENIFGNLFLFAPFGLALPCLFKQMRSLWKFSLVMLVVLVAVEFVQLITYTGSCDIDDVILNLIGAVLFFTIWKVKFIQKLLSKIYVLD